MAFPQFKAAGTTVGQGASGTLTVAWPTHTSGDLGLLFVVGAFVFKATPSNVPILTTKNGFRLVGWSNGFDGSLNTVSVYVFACVATGSSMGSPILRAHNRSLGCILTFTDAANIAASRGVKNNAATGTALTMPNWGSPLPESLILTVFGVMNPSLSFASWANSDLANVTERLDASAGSPTNISMGVASGERTDPASTLANTTATLSSSGSWVGLSLQLSGPVESGGGFRPFGSSVIRGVG